MNTRHRDFLTSGSSSQPGNWHWGVLLFALFGFALFAQFLNQTLYEHQAPFFDSISYYDRVFDVVSIRQQEGLLPALENATSISSTICLPYLLAIPFSYFVEPSRSIGVWVEIIYFGLFLFSFSVFLRQLRGATSREIVFCLIPLFLVGALYRSTAGISDMRFDLPLAFLYVSSACWVLVGLQKARWRYFVVAGIFVGAACLSRAIAPVYFGIGFIPLICHRLYFGTDRKEFLCQIVTVITVALLIAGWFYFLHFKFIYYYYFIWNTDANAEVSLWRSLKHILAALKSIGPFVGLFFLFIFVSSRRFTTHRPAGSIGNAKRGSLEIQWLFWMGCAPILCLVIKRADINPFVSLPGSLALVACWVVAMFHHISVLNKRHLGQLVFASSLLFAMSCTQGYWNHSTKTLNNADAHRRIIQVIQADGIKFNRKKLTYGVNLMTSLSTGSIESMLQFQFESRYIDETTLEINGIQYEASYDLFLPSRANWEKVPGRSIEDKIAILVSSSADKLDYLIAPTPDSLNTIRDHYDYVHSSQFAAMILQRFNESKSWIAISGMIDLEPGISVQVFRNQSSSRITGKPQDNLLR